ncbi:hypothetical protein EV421DRAFT_1789445, partial [Armillaria borealis]
MSASPVRPQPSSASDHISPLRIVINIFSPTLSLRCGLLEQPEPFRRTERQCLQESFWKFLSSYGSWRARHSTRVVGYFADNIVFQGWMAGVVQDCFGKDIRQKNQYLWIPLAPVNPHYVKSPIPLGYQHRHPAAHRLAGGPEAMHDTGDICGRILSNNIAQDVLHQGRRQGAKDYSLAMLRYAVFKDHDLAVVNTSRATTLVACVIVQWLFACRGAGPEVQ